MSKDSVVLLHALTLTIPQNGIASHVAKKFLATTREVLLTTNLDHVTVSEESTLSGTLAHDNCIFLIVTATRHQLLNSRLDSIFAFDHALNFLQDLCVL